MKGKLIVFSAPSGAGKTSIVSYLMQRNLNLGFSVSATSRNPRPGEVHGQDYYFLSSEVFKQKVSNNEFLEWEEVYPETCYGTLKSEVERLRNKGKNVIFDVDVVGGLNIKKYYGEEVLAIFVMPPSIDELKIRLQKRKTETQEKIAMRIAKAEKEISFAQNFDKILINDNLETACTKAEKLVAQWIGL
ncbi:MAG: guanylate kinase [Draconibacterium sp.]|nr:MAG: guanylate kinase [Draconibacterium sp.]